MSEVPRVSLCMIVRDDVARLARCLDSVRGLADEMIVVDTGSTDGTPAVARTRGATVVEIPWSDDFAAARNVALAHARGEWILVLDADEWLPPASVSAIGSLISRAPVEAFHLLQRSEDAEGHVVRAAAVRLFPNRPEVRYRFPLHEEVNHSLHRANIPLRATAIEIRHSGYADAAEIARKSERNRRIVAAALQRGAADPEEELHLRYFRGCFHFDAQEWAPAAEDYAWCLEVAPRWRPPMTDTVRLRLAECCLGLGEWKRAKKYLPAAPALGTHPLALTLAARLSHKGGEEAAARRWYEAVLGAREGVYSPPVILGALRQEAEQFLGRPA